MSRPQPCRQNVPRPVHPSSRPAKLGVRTAEQVSGSAETGPAFRVTHIRLLELLLEDVLRPVAVLVGRRHGPSVEPGAHEAVDHASSGPCTAPFIT